MWSVNVCHMTRDDLAPLMEICAKAGIHKRTYEEWLKLDLVPRYCYSKSLGRGCGREFLYHREDALQCIQLVKDERAKGLSLDEIRQRHSLMLMGPLTHSTLYGYTEVPVLHYLKERLGIADRDARLSFEFVIEQAAEIGAFRQFRIERNKNGELLARIPALTPEGEFHSLLKDVYRVYRDCGPGNAAMYARTVQIQEVIESEGPDVDPNEEAPQVPGDPYKEWKGECERLENAKRYWASRPTSRRCLLPGTR
jgi:hypothetical protein